MAYIQIAGNCTNVELKFTAAGMAMAKFSVAETRKKNDEKLTTWFNVVVFDKLAENVAASLSKGKRVVVAGRIESDDYVNKDGVEVKKFQVIADDVAVSMRWEALEFGTVETVEGVELF